MGKFLCNLGWFYTRPYNHNLDYKILKITGKLIVDSNEYEYKEFFRSILDDNLLQLSINNTNLNPYAFSYDTDGEITGWFKIFNE